MLNKRRNLLKDTKGLSTVEYIIILVLIAVAGIAAWQTFGEKVRDEVQNSTDALPGVGGGGG